MMKSLLVVVISGYDAVVVETPAPQCRVNCDDFESIKHIMRCEKVRVEALREEAKIACCGSVRLRRSSGAVVHVDWRASVSSLRLHVGSPIHLYSTLLPTRISAGVDRACTQHTTLSLTTSGIVCINVTMSKTDGIFPNKPEEKSI